MEGSQTDLISSMTDARVILIIVDHSTLLRAMVAVMVFRGTYPPDRFQTIRPVVLRIVMVDFPRSLIGLTDMDACVHHRMLFHGRPEAPPGGPRSGPQTHPDRVELIHDRSERDRRGLPPLPPRGTTTL
jgi:hypothetical protein